jgi:DNA-binding LacI/PurR family transcriptional regulator
MGWATVNLEDIARLAGVSRSTVSRVVNNDPNVSERSRVLVQATIDRVGYRPNAAARALASHRSHAIGLLVPEDFAQNHVDAWYPLIIEATLTASRDAGQSLVLIMEDTFSPDASARLISQFVQTGRVDGLLLLQHSSDDALTLQLLQRDIPTVLIAESDIPGTCWVDNDNRTGGAAVARLMKEQGVTGACAVTAMLAHAPSRRRIEGFQGEIPRTQIVLTSHSVQSAEELIRALLAANHPEAIFAVNGWIAPVIYRVAAELGINIPGDMVVAAFDDFDPDYSQRVGLTSVEQHVSQLAKHAVALLIDRVEGRAPPGQTIVLDSPLVQRGSCKELAFTPIQGGVPAT